MMWSSDGGNQAFCSHVGHRLPRCQTIPLASGSSGGMTNPFHGPRPGIGNVHLGNQVMVGYVQGG